jgi:hypothetical protein
MALMPARAMPAGMHGQHNATHGMCRWQSATNEGKNMRAATIIIIIKPGCRALHEPLHERLHELRRENAGGAGEGAHQRRRGGAVQSCERRRRRSTQGNTRQRESMRGFAIAMTS